MTVSVILTCHNEELFIGQAIQSVISQSDFERILEIIVVNDGSSDNSKAVLDKIASETNKLIIINSPGLGLPAARNLAVRDAKGEFIAILDGDDYWSKDKLARQLPVFAENKLTGLVYSDFVDFSRDDETDSREIRVRHFSPESTNQLVDYFVHDAPIVPSTAILRREVFETVGLFDELLRVGEDTEFFLRVAEKWRFCHVPGAYTHKRRRVGQITQRLDILLPTVSLVTDKFSERHPKLAKYAGRRMARFHVKISVDCALKGEWRNAVGHAFVAIHRAPLYVRAWANLLLLVAPAPIIRPIYNGLKKPWYAFQKMKYRELE